MSRLTSRKQYTEAYRQVVVHETLQALITLVLLGFAYAMRTTDTTVSSIIVGATVTHWLRESQHAGQQVGELVARNTTGTHKVTHAETPAGD